MVLQKIPKELSEECKDVGYVTIAHSFPETVKIKFTDEFHFDGRVKKFSGLGEIHSLCTAHFHKLLSTYNIPTAYVDSPNSDEIVFIKHQKLPILIRIHNYSNKTFNKIFNLKEKIKLVAPIYEIYHKNHLKYPLNEYHLLSFNIISLDESREIIKLASKVNIVIKSFFERRGYDLQMLELEFGKGNSQIFLTTLFTIDKFKLKPHNSNQPNFDFEKIPLTKLREVFISFQKMIY